MSASYPILPHPDGKNFHSAGVSIPISIPSRPGEKITGSIPFGPPVLHEDPEKTHNLFYHPLYTDNQTQINTNYHNSFFRIDGPCIVPPEFFDQYEDNDDDDDVNMEIEGQEA